MSTTNLGCEYWDTPINFRADDPFYTLDPNVFVPGAAYSSNQIYAVLDREAEQELGD